MTKAQEANAKAQTRLRQLEPLANQMSRAPAQEPDYDPEIGPFPGSHRAQSAPQDLAANPLYWDVTEIKQKLADQDIREAVSALDRNPAYQGFMNNEIKRDILLEAAATGNYDAEGIFLKKYAGPLMEHAKRAAIQEAMQTIQKNNAAGAGLGSPSPGGTAPTVNPQRLPAQQVDAWLDDELRRIDSEPGYAEKIVQQHEAQNQG
jgi:hypothetical protein